MSYRLDLLAGGVYLRGYRSWKQTGGQARVDRTDIQITTALSSYRAHTRPHGGKCGGEGDGGLEAHEHLDTSRPALQHHLKLSCGQRRARSYHPGRHPPPGPPAVHGRELGRWGSRGLRAAVAAAETRTQAAPNAAAQPQRPAGRRHGTPTRLGRPCAAVPPRPGGAAAQKRSQKRPQTRPYSSRSGTTGTDAGLVHSDGGRLASSRARHQYTS